MVFNFLMTGLETLGQDVVGSLNDLWDWGKPILNVLIMLAVAYFGISGVMKYFQGDSSAGKTVVMILVGAIVWFIILVPMVDNYLSSGGSGGALPWDN